MDIEKILGLNISEARCQKIVVQEKLMQSTLIKMDNFSDKLEYVTFFINNMFNIINDENILTFKEYKDLNMIGVDKYRGCKRVKQIKKYKGWKK